MAGYLIDLSIVAVLVIGLTALMGPIANGIGIKFFGGKKRNEYIDQSRNTQNGWKQVGGNKKHKTS